MSDNNEFDPIQEDPAAKAAEAALTQLLEEGGYING